MMSCCTSRYGLVRLIPASRAWITRSLSLYARRRFYSISHDVERHHITCGLSGQIIVELHNASLVRSSPRVPLVIYLPPYPSSPPSPPPSWLLRNFPVLSIPYRWSHNPSVSFRITKTHAFPIPLHDTLQAYTWLLNTYLPPLFPYPPPPPSGFYPRKPIQRPLLIYGSYLGGTLATSLALTESHISTNQRTKIHSLVVHNGIFDWTPISTTPDPVLFNKSSISPYISTPDLYSQKPWTTDTLHSLKTRLFPSPSHTFDAFASPILFFRTPGIQVPRRWPIPEPPKSKSSSSRDSPTKKIPIPPSLEDIPSPPDDPEDYDMGSPPSNLWDDEPEEHPHEPLVTSRKSYLVFPTPNSALVLPRSLFLYSKSSLTENTGDDGRANGEFDIFREQAEEMQKFMQRSIKMHELRDRARWDDECDPEAIAGERVSVKGVGWDAVKGGGGIAEAEEAEVESVVKGWFEEGGL